MVQNTLYIFDLDETLLNGDSSKLFNQFLVKQGIIQDPDFLQQDQRMMELYKQGNLDMQQYLNFAISPLASIQMADLDKLIEQFVKTDIAPRIYTQATALIKQLQDQGKAIIIISATVDFLVAKIAQYLMVNDHIAIQLHTENNGYTPLIKGTPSYQAGKVTRLNEWLKDNNKHFQKLSFYTDSINDLPLCEAADEVHVVNPCAQLAIKAEQHGWEKLVWI